MLLVATSPAFLHHPDSPVHVYCLWSRAKNQLIYWDVLVKGEVWQFNFIRALPQSSKSPERVGWKPNCVTVWEQPFQNDMRKKSVNGNCCLFEASTIQVMYVFTVCRNCFMSLTPRLWSTLCLSHDLMMGTLLRWDSPLRSEGLEEGEEAEADRGVFPAGWLVFRNWTQLAKVSGVQGGPQQEGRGAGTFPCLLSVLLFQTV